MPEQKPASASAGASNASDGARSATPSISSPAASMPVAATRSWREVRVATQPPARMPAAPPSRNAVSAEEASSTGVAYRADRLATPKVCIPVSATESRKKKKKHISTGAAVSTRTSPARLGAGAPAAGRRSSTVIASRCVSSTPIMTMPSEAAASSAACQP